MSSLRRAFLLLVAAPLGSCTTTHPEVEPTVPPGHNFSYLLPNRESLNLIQVFDDGSKTFLQFKEAPSAPIEIRQVSNAKSLSYTIDERYVIASGVYDTLLVTVAGASTTIINQSPQTGRPVAAMPDESVTTIEARLKPMSLSLASDNNRSP